MINDRYAWGLVFVIIGVILLLFSFEVISFAQWWKLWPMIFIMIGIALFFYRGERRIEKVEK